jgi:hypothetical protein
MGAGNKNFFYYIKRAAAFIFPAVVVFFSFKMAELSVPYLQMKHDVDFLRTKYNVYHIDYWRIGFYAHVFTSVFVLLAGALQFSKYVIFKWPRVHRWAGYSYLWLVLFVSGPGAFAMALHANGGLPAKGSFILQTILWFVFTSAAWYYAVKKKWTKHAEAMLLSYSLTFAAVTLRVLVVILGELHIKGLRPVDAYIFVAWMSWVPNMIAAAMLIHLGIIRWFFKGRKTLT